MRHPLALCALLMVVSVPSSSGRWSVLAFTRPCFRGLVLPVRGGSDPHALAHAASEFPPEPKADLPPEPGAAATELKEDDSAEADDRCELRAPYYDGVRVKCLFACEDTGEEQWCAGTIEYTKRSTSELRIAFEEVPAWESATRLYWPVDDADIKVIPGQEGGPSLSVEDREQLSNSMMDMLEVFDWFKVRRALWFGADPLYTRSMGQTVLHVAALAGNMETVKAAIRRSENKVAFLNLETLEGNTPLHYAAVDSECGVLRQLLRAGANLAAKNKYGQMPLHMAEAAGNEKGYRMLHDSMAQRLALLRKRALPVVGGGGAGAAQPTS